MVDIRSGRRAAVLALAAAGLAGCAAAGERPMTAALFMPPPSVVAATPAAVPTTGPAGAGLDDPAAQPAGAVEAPGESSPKKAMILTPGPQEFDSVRPLAPLQPSPTTAPADGSAAAATPSVDPTSPATPPATPPADPTPAAADDASPPPPPTSGVYMTVGGVMAQVNATPIYAHTVLALLEKELAARARDMGAAEFRQYAAGRIVHQIDELVMDELDFSTADKSLTKEDRTLVEAVTAERRADRIKQCGGSVELARRESAAQGEDFEEQMRQVRRHLVVSLYQQRQIDPQVQVSAADMRDFYAANGAKLYGDKDRLLFRVIEIDPDRMTGDEPRVAALGKVRAIHEKAAAGQDFTALASAENHDELLRAHGGDVGGWMDRGSYRVEPVEAALWALRPGQVTDVIEDDHVFYVAKLEDKHQGRTRPFEDPAVQDDILKQLTQRQQLALLDRVRNAAEAESVISTPDGKLETVLEMAMQKYAKWTGR